MANDVTSLSLRPGSAKRLTELAARRGIKQTRGAGAALGLPSVTGFVDAIARGEYVAIRPANGNWAGLLETLHRSALVASETDYVVLRDLIAQIEADAGPEAA